MHRNMKSSTRACCVYDDKYITCKVDAYLSVIVPTNLRISYHTTAAVRDDDMEPRLMHSVCAHVCVYIYIYTNLHISYQDPRR